METNTQRQPGVFEKLQTAHRQISQMAADLGASILDDDREVLRDDFAAFERALLDHMSWEEMYILPSYEKFAPEAAAAIRSEHGEFRARLGEIGIAIDLHSVRASHFEDFADRLRAHAHREEVMFAAFADEIEAGALEAIESRFDRFFRTARWMPLIGP